MADLDATDVRRVAACLKACQGIPTERLEDGVLLRLVAACVHIDDPEVRAALDGLIFRDPDTYLPARPRPPLSRGAQRPRSSPLYGP